MQQQLSPESSASPAAPAPPTGEELQYFYFGLPSCPRLVARSSATIWQSPQRPGFTTFTGTHNMYPKTLRPAGNHPLLHQLWNNAVSSLRVQILNAVSAADWTAVDILRIALNDESHITLMVAVRPKTLSWSDGHAIALQCKKILESHGISDVHCEIRESVVTLCTDAAPIADQGTGTPADFQLSSAPIIPPHEDFKADLSDCLGTNIATKHIDTLSGTKGLYLAISSPSLSNEDRTIVALTCRHVVIDHKRESTQEYRQSEPFKEVIQINQATFMERIGNLPKQVTDYRRIADNATKEGKNDKAAENNLVANSAGALTQAMKPYEVSSSRVFGRVLFSPEFGQASSTSGTKWLRDWALIELLPNHHRAELRSLKNKVYIGKPEVFTSIVNKSKEGWEGLPEPGARDTDDCTIKLQALPVPIDKIIRPDGVTTYNDEPAMLVAKYGAKTGLTIGLGNTLRSFTRCADTLEGPRKDYSEEWAIVSVGWAQNRQEVFCSPGDSGSCIWDMEQRPAGILTAGCGINNLNDVTYAQPVKRLLDDIMSYGFDASLV